MKNFKKNIILSACDEELRELKGVLTIEKSEIKTSAILRIYNLKQIKHNYILGIMIDGKPMRKIALGTEVVFCRLDLDCEINFNSKIIVVVVSNENLKTRGLVWGTTDGLNLKQKPLDYFNTYEIPEKIDKIIDDEIEKAELDKIETTNEPCKCANLEKCKDCEYKNFFYAKKSEEKPMVVEQITIDNLEIKEEEKGEKKPQKSFYQLIEKQISKLFSIYSPMPELTKLIDNSRWVKIPQGNGNYYCIGLIYDNEEVKYISYAVSGDFSETPPEELGTEAQWLPVNVLFPKESGYWLMFQDALTGQ